MSDINTGSFASGSMNIFFLILFIVAVSMIIGLSIIAVIDRKINNVSIKIPNIEPKVIFNVDKDENGNIKISQKNNDKIEEFIVADANDLNYNELREEVIAKDDSFDLEYLNDPENNKGIDYDKKPGDDDFSIRVVHGLPEVKREIKKIIDKEVGKKYVTETDFDNHNLLEDPRKAVSCPNSTVLRAEGANKRHLLPNQISCDLGKIKSEDYYQKNFKKFIAPIEDYNIKGHNYGEYTDSINPYQLRYTRILAQNTKGLPPEATKYKNIPLGYNYVFHNTPAVQMP
jgi:hypothetical protein